MITRRQSLRFGLTGLAAGLAGGPSAAAHAKSARACIVLYMHGGASHIDTFDPKPGRPSGGPFAAIGTRTAGLRVSEHLPGLAARADRLTVIRSLVGTEGNHDRARYLMHTGYRPVGSTQHPALGAMVAAHTTAGALPGYVAVGGGATGAGFLGARNGPFVVPHPGRPIRYLKDASRVSAAQWEARASLWRAQQQDFAATHPSAQVQGHGEVMEQALTMMDAPQIDAFDLQREPPAVRGRYGQDEFAQGCLLARRLVAVGVPFVEVGLQGWDTHEDNFDRVRVLSGRLDAAMSTLLDDLDESGLLQETLVVWLGDFGRSPRINARGGRDHHPRASSVVLAGGPTAGGRVIGATDPDGDQVVHGALSVPDLMRTLAVALGLDPDQTRLTPEGRPITAVDGGTALDLG